jgi:serine/threonine protein kinase
VLLESPSAHRIKITDFGFSKDFLNDSLPKTKRVGTLAYMAPEV